MNINNIRMPQLMMKMMRMKMIMAKKKKIIKATKLLNRAVADYIQQLTTTYK